MTESRFALKINALIAWFYFSVKMVINYQNDDLNISFYMIYDLHATDVDTNVPDIKHQGLWVGTGVYFTHEYHYRQCLSGIAANHGGTLPL